MITIIMEAPTLSRRESEEFFHGVASAMTTLMYHYGGPPPRPQAMRKILKSYVEASHP